MTIADDIEGRVIGRLGFPKSGGGGLDPSTYIEGSSWRFLLVGISIVLICVEEYIEGACERRELSPMFGTHEVI